MATWGYVGNHITSRLHIYSQQSEKILCSSVMWF